MMALRRKGWFLDLAHTSDEVLLLLAQQARCQPARDELTCRHWRRLKAGRAGFTMPSRLTSWDLDDVHQQAFFWIQEAIEAFDLAQVFLPQGSSFQTFLNRVLRLRFLDFCRCQRRRSARLRLIDEQGDWPDRLLPKGGLDLTGYDPDLQVRLEKAASLLDPDARVLWNQLRQGKRLRDLAEVLGVTYRTVKRRWRKLREQLKTALRHPDEQSGK
jgi:RNA polymerase sigma factor (sigma-70 family)